MNKEERSEYVRSLGRGTRGTTAFRTRKKTACQPYAKNGDAKGNSGTQSFIRDVLPKIREHLTGDVLDIGCGNGRLSHLFSETADKVHGIDLYDKQLDKFKNKKITYESVGLGDFFAPNKYDCVFFCGVFYLLHDPIYTFSKFYPDQREYHLEMLKKCKGMLTKDGTIIIIEESHRWVEDPEVWYGKYNLDDLCQKANLKVAKRFIGMDGHSIAIIKSEK